MKTKYIIFGILIINAVAVGLVSCHKKGPADETYGAAMIAPPRIAATPDGENAAEDERDEETRMDDGLRMPESVDGNVSTYKNGDIKITRTWNEGDAAHGYFDYKITFGGRDITPADFRTIEGADCALQKFRFSFSPVFSVVKISRPWEESWVNPTMAVRTEYRMQNGVLTAFAPVQLREVCDVGELF